MSWHYSRALVGVFSAENSLDGEPFAPSSGNPTPQAYLSPDRMTAFSRLSRFGMTFAPLTDGHGEALLMWYLADFRARTSRQPGKAQDSTGSEADFGEKWPVSLARYDRASRSWKTHQCSLLGDLEPYSETWPRWGTMRDGALYPRQTPALRTSESAYGSWPTPKASAAGPDFAEVDRSSTGISLQTAVAMWPTPDANMGARGTQPEWKPTRGSGQPAQYTINQAVRDRFPTPSANEDAAGTPNGKMQKMLGNDPRVRGTTPQEWAGGSLNPTWVEWLMGWPLGWSDSKPLETAKFQRWLRSHGGCSEVTHELLVDASPQQADAGKDDEQTPQGRVVRGVQDVEGDQG